MPGVPTPEILIKLTWSWDQDLLTIFYAKNTVSVLLPQSPALFASRRFWERGTHQNDTGTFLEHLHRGPAPDWLNQNFYKWGPSINIFLGFSLFFNLDWEPLFWMKKKL